MPLNKLNTKSSLSDRFSCSSSCVSSVTLTPVSASSFSVPCSVQLSCSVVLIVTFSSSVVDCCPSVSGVAEISGNRDAPADVSEAFSGCASAAGEAASVN